MNNFEHLKREILALSVSQAWSTAVGEWMLNGVTFADGRPETCLCTHYPIVELCHLRNRVNGKHATVGNCCVKKFMDESSGRVVAATKRVLADKTKALNEDTIELAARNGWITEWEHSFYLNTFRRRVLSERQAAKRAQINHKVLACLVRPVNARA